MTDKKKELTPKEAKFLSEYFKDFNAARAAKDTGYSKKTAKEIGYQILTKLHIKKRVLEEFEKHGSVIQKVLTEYFKIATSDIKDYVIVGEGGSIEAIPFDELEDSKTSVIKEIEENRIIKENKDGSQVTVYDKIKYKLYDKEKALDAICKIAKLFTTNIDLTSGGEKIPQTQLIVYSKGDE